jgi:hypothetical protein
MSNQSSWSSQGTRIAADMRGEPPSVNARQAAEALFKPKPQNAAPTPAPAAPETTPGLSAPAAAAAPPPPDQPPARVPRVIAITPPQPAPVPAAEPEPEPVRAPRKRRVATAPAAAAAVKEDAKAEVAKPEAAQAGKIPASEHGRVRALTTYGMTLEQVADLYGVAVGDVSVIIGKPEPALPPEE